MSDPEVIELTLELEPRLVADLDKLVADLKSSGPAYEFGVRVTREIAARVALLRGLNAGATGAVSKVKAAQPRSESKPAPGHHKPEPEPEVDESFSVILNEDGRIQPPPGWDVWAGELVPQEQLKVHSYYTEQGWSRMHGKVGDETIVFYWSDDPSNQEADAWSGSDMTGKQVVPQETPFGPGHIVPLGWAEV